MTKSNCLLLFNAYSTAYLICVLSRLSKTPQANFTSDDEIKNKN